MTVYYITFLFTFVLTLLAEFFKKKRKIFDTNHSFVIKEDLNFFFVSLVILLLIMVAGLRWRVGTDYVTYQWNYITYQKEFLKDLLSLNEPGIKIIAKLSSFIYDDYATMFFISSLITIYLFVFTIYKNSTMFSFSILLFLLQGTWHGSFNGVRQYLACSIVFAGHRLIVERKIFPFLLVVFIAFLFHKSAIVLVLLYFVPRKRLDFKNILFLVFISIFCLYFFDLVLKLVEIVSKTTLDANLPYITREVNIFRILVQYAPLLIYFILTKKKSLNPTDYFYINIAFINATVFSMFSNSAYLTRMGIYTSSFLPLSYVSLMKFQDKRVQSVIKLIVIFLFCIYWYYEVSRSPNLSNFQWIFNR